MLTMSTKMKKKVVKIAKKNLIHIFEKQQQQQQQNWSGDIIWWIALTTDDNGRPSHGISSVDSPAELKIYRSLVSLNSSKSGGTF